MTDTYLLYKVPIAGGSDEKVVNIPIQKEIETWNTGSYNIKNFYIVDDYIYFTSNGVKSKNTDTLSNTYLLYKVPITGGSDEEVVNIPIQKEIDDWHTGNYNIKNFYIVDDYIYFTSNGVNNTSSNTYLLYKVPITGGSDEKVVNISIQKEIENWHTGNYNIEFFNIE